MLSAASLAGMEPTTAPPSTGNPDVDAALAALSELAERPLAEHHEALAGAHEVLVRQLEAGREAHNPIPTALRPHHG